MINQKVSYVGICPQESIGNRIRAVVALCERQLQIVVEKVREKTPLIRVSCKALITLQLHNLDTGQQRNPQQMVTADISFL